MARLRSITNSNLNLRRRREDKADADAADDDNLRAQVTGDLPGHPSHHQQSINQSIIATMLLLHVSVCRVHVCVPPCVTDFFLLVVTSYLARCTGQASKQENV